MNCEEAQDLMVAHLYGELEGDRAKALGAHLARCPKCAAELDGLSRVRRLVCSRKDPTPSPLVIQRLVTEAREETSRPRALWGLGWLKAAIPLCLMVAAGGWIALHYIEQEAAWKGVAGLGHEDAVKGYPGPERDLAKAEISPSPGRGVEQEEEVSGRTPAWFGKGGGEDKARGDSAFETPPPQRPRMGSQSPAGPLQHGVADTSSHPEARVEGKAMGGAAGEERVGKTENDVRPAQRPTLGLQAGHVSIDRLGRAQTLLEAEDYRAAEDAFSMAVQELRPGDPRLPLALLGLAEAREKLGKMEEALSLYMRLEREFPEYRHRAAERIRALRHGDPLPP